MANIIPITDLSAPELAVYARLTEAQLRSVLEPRLGIFIAESTKVIGTALDAGYRPLSLLCEQKHIDGQAAELIARCGDIPVYTAPREVLAGLAGFALTRSVLCAFRRPPLPEAGEILRDARRVAVLEGVVDSTNIGAIFRSAAALGMDAVLLSPTCCDAYNRRAVRVSMGTVFQVPWCYLPWPEEGLQLLRRAGFTTAAMALTEHSLPIDHPSLREQERLAVILGTEGDGLAASTLAQCDKTVRIPMQHGVDSLNVAAAGAVAFWELRYRKKR